MKRRSLLLGVIAVSSGGVSALFSQRFGAAKAASGEAAAAVETRAVVVAVTAFLDTLDPDQLKKVLFPFIPQKTATPAVYKSHRGDTMLGERYGDAVWSNFPLIAVPRPGLELGTLTAAQRVAAMQVLEVLLSSKGYGKVLEIMGSDQALADSGVRFATGADVYFIGIFGVPSATAPWMLEFGGHHLGLNVVIVGEHGVMTPTLTGAQPSVYNANGKTVRVLAAENDKVFALYDALDPAQREQATLNYHVDDLVLGPGHSGETIVPEGLKASAMTARQRALLLELISEWACIVHDAYAAPRMEEIKAGLEEIYFAWSGPSTHEPGKNGSAYYRIQGPKLVIEFSPQGRDGDPTMHVHTVYRDPTNDYGRAFANP